MSNPNNEIFRALVTEAIDGRYQSKAQNRNISDLPDGDVLIKVHYSSLNYKDALSASGNKGVSQNYPHTPGIDASGVIASSKDKRFSKGDVVIVTGYDLGMNTSGGFAEFIRVPADWIVKKPEGLTPRDSMIYGTAGFTAAQSVHALQMHKVKPDQGKILVTGSTGGVGCLSIAILSRLGFNVVAATGKLDKKDFLKKIGAKEVVDRASIIHEPDKPLLKQKWAGVVDTLGGSFLSTAIRSTMYNGCVTCCGMLGGLDLSTSIFPFILRGLSLVGINSERCDMGTRDLLWKNLGGPWKPDCLDSIARECGLDELPLEIEKILRGEQVGRVVVRLL